MALFHSQTHANLSQGKWGKRPSLRSAILVEQETSLFFSEQGSSLLYLMGTNDHGIHICDGHIQETCPSAQMCCATSFFFDEANKIIATIALLYLELFVAFPG